MKIKNDFDIIQLKIEKKTNKNVIKNRTDFFLLYKLYKVLKTYFK